MVTLLEHTPTMLTDAARRFSRQRAVGTVVERLAAGELRPERFEAEKALAEHAADLAFTFESEDDAHALWEQVAASRSQRLRRSRRRLDAYVNQGRWVADCVECGGGIAVSPAHTRCCCLDCLTLYAGVHFPDDRDELERALVDRPAALRNWTPGESLADLLEENFRHGHGQVAMP